MWRHGGTNDVAPVLSELGQNGARHSVRFMITSKQTSRYEENSVDTTVVTFVSQRTNTSVCNLSKLTSGLLRWTGGQQGCCTVQPDTVDAAPFKINTCAEALSRRKLSAGVGTSFCDFVSIDFKESRARSEMSLQPGVTSAEINDVSGVARATTSSLCARLHREIRSNQKRNQEVY